MNLFRSLDLQRLAGMNSILGIDLSEQNVKIVELKRGGNPFRAFKMNFEVSRYGETEFAPASSPRQRAQQLKEILIASQMQSRYAVATLKTGIKVVQTALPPDTERVDDWIRENYEKLVRLPLPIQDVSFQYEMLSSPGPESILEIVFVRNAEIHQLKTILQEAGVQLIALSAGSREALTTLLTTVPEVLRKRIELVHTENGAQATYFIEKGRRVLQFSGSGNSQNAQRWEEEDGAIAVTEMILSGEHRSLAGGAGEVPAFGLSGRFALAVGLAIKGFVPQLSPMDFHNTGDKELFHGALYRSLFHRSVLALGSLLLILLLGPFMALYWIQSSIDDVDERLVSSTVHDGEVVALEKQVSALEQQVQGKSGSRSRSAVSRFMHRLAALTPEGVWLTKASLGGKGAPENQIRLSGFARDNESVTNYLKALERSGLCLEIDLERSGSPRTIGVAGSFRNFVPLPVTFEMRGLLRK